MKLRMKSLTKDKSLRGGEGMSPAYDLFERLPDGQPMWVKAVASMDDAQALIVNLIDSRGAVAKDFFVYDVKRGAVVGVPEARV
jgi:hypothetical protein